MRTLKLLNDASKERHDEPTLRARMPDQIASITRQTLRTPNLSPRLQRLVQQPASMKAMDAEDLVIALGKVIDEDDELLQIDLLSLTVTVARLGSVLLAMRLGRLIIEEMIVKGAKD